MLRIGIEAQRIFRPKKHGMDIVALEIIKALVQLEGDFEVVVFVKPDSDRVLESGGKLTVVEVPGKTYADWEQLSLPKAVRKSKVDVLHCTSNTAPIRGLSVPLVLTLHDIIFLEKRMVKEGTTYQKLGNVYRRWVVPKIIEKAAKVITVSNFERNRMNEHFGGLATLDYIYNGVSEHFKVPVSEVEMKTVLEQFGIQAPYVFFLGNTDPKKNVPNTLKAFDQFAATHPEVQLVVLDYAEEELDKQLEQLSLMHLKDRIHLLGYVPNKQLPVIYAGAEVFWYPSLRESFGIPILEAQGMGTKVVTSNTSSMPEVGGEGVWLADPNNPTEMAAVLVQAYAEQGVEKVEKGKENVQKFTWTEAAKKCLAIYQGL